MKLVTCQARVDNTFFLLGVFALISGLGACGSSAKLNVSPSAGGGTDGNSTYTLTIDTNTRCTVTATVDGNQVATTGANGSDLTLQGAANATVGLNARGYPVPQPTGAPAPSFNIAWSGTTGSSNPTTYIMTTNANQRIGLYCDLQSL
jgi:hypothetical protein